jgi:hypothetical protein
MPEELSSYLNKSAGDADKSLGNQASGTPKTRPSESETHMVASSNLTSVAEMFMPRPFDLGTVLVHNAHDIREFPAVEHVAIGERNLRFQPDLRIITSPARKTWT